MLYTAKKSVYIDLGSDVHSALEPRVAKSDAVWKVEIRKAAAKYHIIGAWVGVIFNILFAISDLVNCPQFWINFLYVRIFVSAVTLCGILLHRRLNWSIEWVIYIPVVLICIQNAYMWSFMDATLMLKHTLSYIAALIGAGMLVIWEMKYSISVIVISLVANVYFLAKNSFLDVETILASGGVLTFSVAVFSILLIQTRYKLNKKETIARLSLVESNRMLHVQKEIIEEKGQSIIESIQYAQTIQEAILPGKRQIGNSFEDSFVLFLPKDIVSGDFYWHHKTGETTIIAAVDCTGHGVPGAFMSMIGNTLMNKIIIDRGITSPAEILNQLRKGVIGALMQGETMSKDSMDIALCTIHHDKNIVEFAGANNPLILLRGGAFHITKGDKMPIGSHYKMEKIPFKNHEIPFESGDQIYLCSDGFNDQFGGKNDKKFSVRQFKALLLQLENYSMSKQYGTLLKAFDEWKGNQDQIDDVLVLGMKL